MVSAVWRAPFGYRCGQGFSKPEKVPRSQIDSIDVRPRYTPHVDLAHTRLIHQLCVFSSSAETDSSVRHCCGSCAGLDMTLPCFTVALPVPVAT
jgi:hypothetical protein